MPKTGGSTLRHVLRCSFGAGHCDIKVPPSRRKGQEWIGPEDLVLARKFYPRLAGICGHRVTCFMGLEEVAPDLRYFTWMREPIRRFMSNYQHDLRDSGVPDTPDALRAFAADPRRRNIMTRMLCGGEDGAAAIRQLKTMRVFVGLTQWFDESFVMFAQWLARPELKTGYSTRNQAPGLRRSVEQESHGLMEVVEDANREDLVVYRYVVDHLYPEQRRTYVGDLAGEVTALRQRNEEGDLMREPVLARVKRGFFYKPGLHVA
ncbi:MAG TPA: hypothetical protein PKE55_07350 [Kiritimatiellia bacterium]|nr:hypothetical protein [Kiritimatiellia bacterium]